jgi:hypothetical protein
MDQFSVPEQTAQLVVGESGVGRVLHALGMVPGYSFGAAVVLGCFVIGCEGVIEEVGVVDGHFEGFFVFGCDGTDLTNI